MILANKKHEHFAQLVVSGVSNRNAAITAGYSEATATEAGSRLFADVKIKARVKELQRRQSAQTVNSVSIDKSWVIEGLRELAEKAREDEHWSPAAAVKAFELIGKDLGMFRDFIRVEVVNSMFAKMGEVVANLVQDQELLEKIMFKWQCLAEDSAIEVAVREVTAGNEQSDEPEPDTPVE